MKRSGNIGAGQLFCLLFSCRFLSSFTVLSQGGDAGIAARLQGLLYFAVLGTALGVPLLLSARERTGLNVPEKGVGRFAAAIYLLYALFACALGAARFGLFLSTLLFEGTGVRFLLLLLLLCAAVTAKKGLETIGRFSAFVLFLLLLSVCFSVGTTLRYFDPANLAPREGDAFPAAAKETLTALCASAELPLLPVVFARVSGRRDRALLLWFPVFTLIAGAVEVVIAGVVGAYGGTQIFRLHALTVLASLGAFERIDNLICAVWTLCAFLRASFALLCAGEMTDILLSSKAAGAVKPLLPAAVFAAAALICRDDAALMAASSAPVGLLSVAVLYLGFPLVQVIKHRRTIKRGRERA